MGGEGWGELCWVFGGRCGGGALGGGGRRGRWPPTPPNTPSPFPNTPQPPHPPTPKKPQADDLQGVASDVDVLYMTRIQKERFSDMGEYAAARGGPPLPPLLAFVAGAGLAIGGVRRRTGWAAVAAGRGLFRPFVGAGRAGQGWVAGRRRCGGWAPGVVVCGVE